MRLLFSSLFLGVVWFAAANAIVSLMAWPLGAWLLGRFRIPGPRRTGAGLFLAVRLLPFLASSVFVLAVFLPAHWRFEPVEADESFGLVLGGLAAIGLSLAVRAAWRAGQGALAGHRFARLTRRAGNRVAGDGIVIGGLPGVSLAGIWRPRILIGAETLSALTPAELDVAISHEVAHRRSQDNLKRFLLYCAPDLFGWTRVARQLEERWQAEAECEADAAAVMGDGQRAVVLASALVKVARLGRAGTIHQVSRAGLPGTPAWISRSTPPWIMWSAFHVPTLLEMRVRRLVSSSGAPSAATGRLRVSGATLGLGIPVGLWLSGFSHLLHLVTEAMVTRLP
jgi:Zn-dependent protease with chaperone function